jgi:predicted aspartyl protease
MKLLSCCLVAAMLLFPSAIRAQQNLAMADAAKPQAIPIHWEGGFLIEVEGGIGPLEGLKFILDTGTTHSVIDRKIANRLSAVRRPGKVFNFDGFVSVDWAEFPDVRFGPIEVRNVSMLVTELAKSSDLIGNADAIIGLDLLNTVAKLDICYDSKMVVLTPRDANAQGGPEGKQPGYIAVQAMVQGHPIRLLLDTGMEGIVLYEDRIQKRVPHLRLTEERKGAHMGRLQGKTARLPDFRLDGHELDAKAFLMNGPREDLLPGIIDGYLGAGPLKAKRIEIDFEGKTMRWQ